MRKTWLQAWHELCEDMNKRFKKEKEDKMNKEIIKQLEEFVEKLRRGILKITNIEFNAGTVEIAPTWHHGTGYRNYRRSYEDSMSINYIGCEKDEEDLAKRRKYYETVFYDRKPSPFMENTERMKFPFWCWYVETGSTAKNLGQVFKINDKLFCLMKADKQIKEGSNLVDYSEDLFHLVAKRHIVVCKGKAIIWE